MTRWRFAPEVVMWLLVALTVGAILFALVYFGLVYEGGAR